MGRLTIKNLHTPQNALHSTSRIAVQSSFSPIPCKTLNKLIPACYPYPVFAKLHPRRAASLRHVTKNPSPQLLYFPHLQNRDARNSFRFCSYVNWWVSPDLFSLSLSSHSPYTLPSSVSCKSCICHSYENTGGVGVFFPFWNAPFASRMKLRDAPFTSRRLRGKSLSTDHWTRNTSHQSRESPSFSLSAPPFASHRRSARIRVETP
jgi:hypothetical protein